MKNDSHRLCNFYKLIFAESLIIFLEPKTKLITGIFSLKKYHDSTSAFLRYFFRKRPSKRTQSDVVLRDKAFEIASDPKYDGY